jgi:hypothetical protein
MLPLGLNYTSEEKIKKKKKEERERKPPNTNWSLSLFS